MWAAVIDEKHAAVRDRWRRTRLHAIKLTARGDHTSAEVADLCGIARGHLFRGLAAVRKGGLEALLTHDKPGPKESSPRGVSPAILDELKAKLDAGDFVTGIQAQRWLEEKHGISRPYKTLWRWLKKAGGVLLVPRPSHSKKDPTAAEVLAIWCDSSGIIHGGDTKKSVPSRERTWHSPHWDWPISILPKINHCGGDGSVIQEDLIHQA